MQLTNNFSYFQGCTQMNLTKEQLKDIVASSIKAQLEQAGDKNKTRMTRSELKKVVREMIESSLTEGRGACAECGNAYEECECEEENEMCEKCGEKHNEMSECGAGYTKTTVMEAKEFQAVIRQMIIEESADLKKKFLTETYHERGNSERFEGYDISYLEKDLGFPIERMPDSIDYGYTLACIPQDGSFIAGREGQKQVKAGYYFCDDDCEVIDLESRFNSPEEAYREAANREDEYYAQGPGGPEERNDPYYSQGYYRESANSKGGKAIQEIWPFEKPSRKSDNNLVMTSGRRILNMYNHFTSALEKISNAPEGSDKSKLVQAAYDTFQGLSHQLGLFMRDNAQSQTPVEGLELKDDALKYVTREYTGAEKRMPNDLVIDDIYSYADFFKFLQDYFARGSRKLGRYE